MSSNYIKANDINKEDESQSSKVKLKIRITLIFRTFQSSQKAICKAFRAKDDIDRFENGEDIGQELSGSEIVFTDLDEKSGEYVIKDKTYNVDETSPKAMMQMSKSIDDYVKFMCNQSDVESAIVCFFIPSLSDAPIIPTLFFQSFAPKCVQSECQKKTYAKIENKNSYIFYFGFDKIERYANETNEEKGGANNGLTQTIVQLSALICQYTYFYIDYYEVKDWSIFKDTKTSIASREFISDYFSKPETKENNSLWQKVGKAISTSLSLPIKAVQKTFDFLCNYDGHLKGRIYKRIKEITDITGKNPYETIEDILQSSKIQGKPVCLYEYFQKGGYWDEYLRNDILKEEARKWKIVTHTKGKISGYGSLLFTNGIDYICCMKGTDFDSYGRDWILTNLLQGLTGFSLQHVRAVVEGKKLDAEVGIMGNVWFTGHSLGGGLTSAATIATKGRMGITFNAAGLNVMGVKVNQLFNNPISIIHPDQSWNRVFPYRIQGEVLDQAQKKYLRPITMHTLERGYGKKSVEVNLVKDGSEISCLDRHGINNFLYKEVVEQLQPFNNISDRQMAQESTKYNKVVKIDFSTKNANFQA